MAIREILRLGNPHLRERSVPVRGFESKKWQALAVDLQDTLNDFRARKGFGRGIAAPQIGANHRVIFVCADQPMPLINPVIVRRSHSKMTLWMIVSAFLTWSPESGDIYTSMSGIRTFRERNTPSGRKVRSRSSCSMKLTTLMEFWRSTGQSIRSISSIVRSMSAGMPSGRHDTLTGIRLEDEGEIVILCAERV